MSHRSIEYWLIKFRRRLNQTRFHFWGDPRDWSDTPSQNLSKKILNFVGILLFIMLIVATFLQAYDWQLLTIFVLVPGFAFINMVYEILDAKAEEKIRYEIAQLLLDAEKALLDKNLGDFEWSFWKLVKVYLRKTKLPYTYSVLKLLQRSVHVGLSEEIRPHIVRMNHRYEQIGESIYDVRQAVLDGQYSSTANAIADLFVAYLYSAHPSQDSSQSKKEIDRQVLLTLRSCTNDLSNGRVGLAIGRIRHMLDELPKIAKPSDAKLALLIGNWLFQKLREIERVRPSDYGVIWATRFELIARHLETIIEGYESENSQLIMEAIVDSYDRTAKTVSRWPQRIFNKMFVLNKQVSGNVENYGDSR
jgi:hypothetical protein